MRIKIFCLIMLFWAMSCEARMVASPDAIIVKQINGQLYHQTRHQWTQTESVDQILTQPLEPANWHHIIANGEPELAKALLRALGELLTRREFLPYAFSGMNRTPDPVTPPQPNSGREGLSGLQPLRGSADQCPVQNPSGDRQTPGTGCVLE